MFVCDFIFSTGLLISNLLIIFVNSSIFISLWFSFSLIVSRLLSFKISISINFCSWSEILCFGSVMKIVSTNCLKNYTFSSLVIAFLLPNVRYGYSAFSFSIPRIFLIFRQSFGSDEILIFLSFFSHHFSL